MTEWALNLVRPNGFFVPLGLPPEGWKPNAFTVIFNQISVVGSVVVSKEQAQDMLDTTARYGVKSGIAEVPLDRAGKQPEVYMNPHLKGRLVVKIADERGGAGDMETGAKNTSDDLSANGRVGYHNKASLLLSARSLHVHVCAAPMRARDPILL